MLELCTRQYLDKVEGEEVEPLPAVFSATCNLSATVGRLERTAPSPADLELAVLEKDGVEDGEEEGRA